MMGTPTQTGIIPRICNDLFDRIAKVSTVIGPYPAGSWSFDGIAIVLPQICIYV